MVILKGATMGRFKYQRKGVKMDRTTEDITALVPPEIMKHYKDMYLDIDIYTIRELDSILIGNITGHRIYLL